MQTSCTENRPGTAAEQSQGPPHRWRARREKTMATINVVNLGGKKVGDFELLDEVFAVEINDGLLGSRPGTHAPRCARAPRRPRPAASFPPAASCKPEGHRPRAYRVHPQPALAFRGYRAWSPAPLVRLPVPAEEADGRAALGYRGEDRGRQVHDRRHAVIAAEAEGQALSARRSSKLQTGKTTLLVETSKKLDEKLFLGSRNLAGVELVLSKPRFILTTSFATSMPSSRRMHSRRCRRR